MNKYIYIDTSLLSSLVAQENALGIRQSSSHSAADSITNTSQFEKRDPAISTEAGIGMGLNANAKIDHEQLTHTNTEELAESVTKNATFKTHSINLLNEYLKTSNEEIIQVTGQYKYFDIDEIIEQAQLSLVDLFDHFIGNEKKKLFESKYPSNTPNRKKALQDFEGELKIEKENMKTGVAVMQYLKLTLPSHIYLETTDYIVPLNSKYFLYDSKIIQYLFTGETSLVGFEGPSMIGEKTSDQDESVLLNLLDSLKDSKAALLTSLDFDLNKKLLIPITWYQ